MVIWAKRIVAERDAFKAEVQALQSGVTGVLRLGVVPSASATVALPVAAFCTAHPLAKVQIKSGLPSTEIGRRLHDFELDAGVTYVDASEDPGLDVVPLYDWLSAHLSSDKSVFAVVAFGRCRWWATGRGGPGFAVVGR